MVKEGDAFFDYGDDRYEHLSGVYKIHNLKNIKQKDSLLKIAFLEANNINSKLPFFIEKEVPSRRPATNPPKPLKSDKPSEIDEQERKHRDDAQREQRRAEELRIAKFKAEQLSKLAAEKGFEVVESEGGEISVRRTLASYDILDPEQISEVAQSIEPWKKGDVLSWGARIMNECADVQSRLMDRDIRLMENPSNDAIREATQLVRVTLKQQESTEKQGFLSRLFSLLSFWKQETPSSSRSLAVVQTPEQRYRETSRLLGIIKDGLQEDLESCVREFVRYDGVRENYSKHGNALMWHEDAMSVLKKNLGRYHHQQSLDNSRRFEVDDPDQQRQTLDDKQKELQLKLEVYRGGFAQLDHAMSAVEKNRHDIRFTIDTVISGSIMLFDTLIGLEREKADLMAATSSVEMKKEAFKHHLAEIERQRQIARDNIFKNMDAIDRAVDVFDRRAKALEVGDAQGALSVEVNAPLLLEDKRPLALPAPEARQ